MAGKKHLPGTYSDEAIALFEHACQAGGYTGKNSPEACLRALLTGCAGPTPTDIYDILDIPQDMRSDVDKSILPPTMDRLRFVRQLVLDEVKRMKRRQADVSTLDLQHPENRERRKGTGYQHLTTVLQMLMERNSQATEWYQRLYITAEQLAKHSGSMPQLVRRFLQDHTAEVQAHHQHLGWHTPEQGKSHNHKAGNFQRDLARQQRKREQERTDNTETNAPKISAV